MPNSSETPETNFCASVLAKAVKIEDSFAFAIIHDALGSRFDTETLSTIEQLATDFSELPLHILDRKIDWLKSHGIEPIHVNAVFSGKRDNTKKSVEKVVVTDVKSEEATQTCDFSSKNEDKSEGKKRNKKGKKKKNQPEQNQSDTNTLTLQETRKEKAVKKNVEAEDSISTILADIEKAGEPPAGAGKRKKKKKKKKTKQVREVKIEQVKEEQKTNSQEIVDCKSPVDMPLFDSGIGSCVASGGEDKSSILSGGTVESVGENSEASPAQCYNFDYDGSNYIREYLEKLHNDHNSENKNNPEMSKFVEFTFGSLNLLPSTEINTTKEGKKHRKIMSLKKPSSVKLMNSNIWNTEKKSDVVMKNGEFEFSFKVPTVESVAGDQQVRIATKSLPKFRDVEVKGGFDHASAVQFLTDEWKKTLENPLMQWCP